MSGKNSGLPSKSISVSVSLPQWLVDLVDMEMEELIVDSRSAIIATSLKEHFERRAEGEMLEQARKSGVLKEYYQKQMEE